MNIDRNFAKILWDYNQCEQEFVTSDFIFVMCSYNLDVANHAYHLFQKKLGQKIVLSGGIAHQNDLLDTGWNRPEAHIFRDRLLALGADEDCIIIEDQATNCGENIQFTKAILQQKMPEVKTGLITQKPYMGRRAYATACKQWPKINWRVNTPAISYEDYVKYTTKSVLLIFSLVIHGV